MGIARLLVTYEDHVKILFLNKVKVPVLIEWSSSAPFPPLPPPHPNFVDYST